VTLEGGAAEAAGPAPCAAPGWTPASVSLVLVLEGSGGTLICRCNRASRASYREDSCPEQLYSTIQ
jgi:hypothetical protein